MTLTERTRAETIEECAQLAKQAITNGVVILSAEEVATAIRSLHKLPVIHAYGKLLMGGVFAVCGIAIPEAHAVHPNKGSYLTISCGSCLKRMPPQEKP